VDLAGDENMYPPALHEKAFKLAKSYNLKITIHAGETGISQNIVDSIILLHADRIGHGTAALKDESVIKLLKERDIPLEICIKSNLDTKIIDNLYDHPILTLFKLGVKVTLNTDNTTVSNTNIMKEYERLIKLGFSLK
jgi:adenosine deaminase